MAWGFGDDDEENSSFTPVDSWGSTNDPASNSTDYWGWDANSQNKSDWHFSNGEKKDNGYWGYSTNTTKNFYNTEKQSSSLYSIDSHNSGSFLSNNDQNKGHWSSQQGYGFGDSWGFGNDHNILDMENLYSWSTWGKCDGSSWNYSNAQRDLDLYHGINVARRKNESNSAFASTWGHKPADSHYKSEPLTEIASFNPFSTNKDKT